jgi:hypothetical protein
MSRELRVATLCAVVILLGSNMAQAQEPSPELIQISRWIEERRHLIASWEFQRRMQIGVAIFTSVLGIVIAVLQAAERKSVRVLTVAFSATVVALTALTNTVFDADHRSLRRASLKARTFLETCEALASLYPQSPAERREELFERIRDGLRNIDDMGSSFTTAHLVVDEQGDSGGFFAVVFADGPAAAPPSWALATPTSSEYFYFVGAAESSSLKTAEVTALGNAYAISLEHAGRALRTIRGKQGYTPADQQALRAYLEKSSNVIDRRLAPTANGTFKAWVLVQTRKSFLDPPALSAFVHAAPAASTWPTPEAVGLKLIPLPAGAAASREAVRVSGARQHTGDFEFTFQLVRTAAGLAVRLDSIRVDHDGSAGATRWAFDVFVNDRHVGAVSPESYDDGRRPPVYVPRGAVETVVSGRSAKAPLAVRVIGFRS